MTGTSEYPEALAPILERLEGVTREGTQWRCICPIHGGDALLVGLNDKGKPLLHCFGCEDDGNKTLIAELLKLGINLGRIAQEEFWEYKADNGDRFQIVRCTFKDGTIGKRPRHYDPSNPEAKKNGWVWKAGTDERPLYQLDKVREAVRKNKTIRVTDGESDAEAFLSRRLYATTNPFGGDNWHDEHARELTGAIVELYIDVDTKGAGYRHGLKRYESLRKYAASVTIYKPADGCKDIREQLDIKKLPIDARIEITVFDLEREVGRSPKKRNMVSFYELDYANVLAGEDGRILRYIPDEKNYVTYDTLAGRWREDQYDYALYRAKKLVEEVRDEMRGKYEHVLTKNTSDSDSDKSARKAAGERMKSAEHICTAAHIAAIVTIARWLRPIVTTREKFNPDPYLINFTNGTYDLRTNELREHRSSDMITMMAGVAYVPIAEGPSFQRYFDFVQPAQKWQEQVWRDIGYSLPGKNGDFAFIHTGSGGNGKTTLFQLVSRALGDYAQQASWKVLAHKGEDEHETLLASLEGQHVSVVRMGGHSLSSEQLRMLVAEYSFSARGMRENEREIIATHTFHVMQNEDPRLDHLDPSTRRRLVVIPWNVTIESPEYDLVEELTAELEYVAAKIIDGYHRWNPLEIERSATEAYFERSPVYAFVSNVLERTPSTEYVTFSAIRSACDEWCRLNGATIKDTALGRMLGEQGYPQKRIRIEGHDNKVNVRFGGKVRKGWQKA